MSGNHFFFYFFLYVCISMLLLCHQTLASSHLQLPAIHAAFLDSKIVKIRNQTRANTDLPTPKILLLVYGDDDMCPAKCIEAEKTLTSLYNELKDRDINNTIPFYKIDIIHNREIRHRFDIMRYPTFLLLDAMNSHYYKFDGIRNISNLKAFWELLKPIGRENVEIQQSRCIEDTSKKASFCYDIGKLGESIVNLGIPLRFLIETKSIVRNAFSVGWEDLKSLVTQRDLQYWTPELLLMILISIFSVFCSFLFMISFQETNKENKK